MLVLVTADSIREDEVYGLFYNVTEPVHLMISAIDRRIITTEMSDFYLCIFSFSPDMMLSGLLTVLYLIHHKTDERSVCLHTICPHTIVQKSRIQTPFINNHLSLLLIIISQGSFITFSPT